MDKLLEASIRYLHNCCLIIFVTHGASSFFRIEDDICDSNGVELWSFYIVKGGFSSLTSINFREYSKKVP